MADILSVVNYIRTIGTEDYKNRVPVATQDNIQSVANPILTYSPIMNEFINSMVNKIAFTSFQKRTFVNPLSILKTGAKPLGYDVENVHVNPATAKTYDPTGSGLLLTTKPDVKTEYFRLNRQDEYPITIWRDSLRHAFTSWENLNEMVDEIINSLYSGDSLDEFILMKATIAGAINDQKMMTAGVTAVTDAATATAFVTAVKSASSQMTFASTAWNGYAKSGGGGNPVMTWTPKESQILLIRSDILDFIDVNVLSAAFNMDKAAFMGRVLPVDNFGSMTNCLAVLADEAFLKVYEDLQEMNEFYNPQGRYTNYFFHHHQTYAFSLFANAVAFVDDVTAPIAPVVTAPAAAATVIAGTGEAGSEVFVVSAGVMKHKTVAVGGAWSITGWTALVEGAVITAYQVDDAGNKSPNGTATVTA